MFFRSRKIEADKWESLDISPDGPLTKQEKEGSLDFLQSRRKAWTYITTNILGGVFLLFMAGLTINLQIGGVIASDAKGIAEIVFSVLGEESPWKGGIIFLTFSVAFPIMGVILLKTGALYRPSDPCISINPEGLFYRAGRSRRIPWRDIRSINRDPVTQWFSKLVIEYDLQGKMRKLRVVPYPLTDDPDYLGYVLRYRAFGDALKSYRGEEI